MSIFKQQFFSKVQNLKSVRYNCKIVLHEVTIYFTKKKSGIDFASLFPKSMSCMYSVYNLILECILQCSFRKNLSNNNLLCYCTS